MRRMLTAGTQVGPYEVLAAIVSGGMGEVYKARDSRDWVDSWPLKCCLRPLSRQRRLGDSNKRRKPRPHSLIRTSVTFTCWGRRQLGAISSQWNTYRRDAAFQAFERRARDERRGGNRSSDCCSPSRQRRSRSDSPRRQARKRHAHECLASTLNDETLCLDAAVSHRARRAWPSLGVRGTNPRVEPVRARVCAKPCGRIRKGNIGALSRDRREHGDHGTVRVAAVQCNVGRSAPAEDDALAAEAWLTRTVEFETHMTIGTSRRKCIGGWRSAWQHRARGTARGRICQERSRSRDHKAPRFSS
jgi:hypothetical protein